MNEVYLLLRAIYVIVVIALIFIAFDILTGILTGIKEKNLMSKKLREGMWHKLGFILVIFFAIVLECALVFFDFPYEVPSTAVVCVYIVFTECVSIFENLCILNPSLVNSPFGQIFRNDNKVIEGEELESDNHINDFNDGYILAQNNHLIMGADNAKEVFNKDIANAGFSDSFKEGYLTYLKGGDTENDV